jgi:hypothetical protein
MRSTADSTDLSDLQKIHGTTEGKALATDDLLALRTFFLLLDAWDRNSNPATSVDTQTESGQGERHTRSVTARRPRAA